MVVAWEEGGIARKVALQQHAKEDGRARAHLHDMIIRSVRLASFSLLLIITSFCNNPSSIDNTMPYKVFIFGVESNLFQAIDLSARQRLRPEPESG